MESIIISTIYGITFLIMRGMYKHDKAARSLPKFEQSLNKN